MRIIPADNNSLKNLYIKFMRSVYAGNMNYKDINTVFARNFLFKEDLFSKKCEVYPVLVEEAGRFLACATCIIYEPASEVFLSFFEAFPGQDGAVAMIIDYARALAKSKAKTKIIIGINGHISYTVGILANNYDKPQTFDSNYNPSYYVDYFEKYCTAKKEAVSYRYDLEKISFDSKVLEDIYGSVTFRKLDEKHYKEDILIFGDLCDKSLRGTPFYYEKTKEEMYDSLKQMRLIFKAEDLVFAVKDGVEVGFILMHPDYNQAIKGQRLTPLKILAGALFNRRKIDTLILNVIGVLPEHRNNKIIIGLLNEARQIAEGRYRNVISTFVMKDNAKSTKLCSSFSAGESDRYFIYEIGI